ncbi:MAG: NTE family protein [Candidatus Azotimanducaceae bacterium]|jgi:NTE family protein
MADMNRISETVSGVLETYFELPAGEGELLARELETVYLEGGYTLFHQGAEADSLYLLVRGRLQVWIDAEKPIYLGEVLPGESVGEVGLITGERRSADVVANRSSVLVRLDRTAFERLAAAYPSMVMKLTTIVARRLHQNTTGANTRKRPAPTIICLRPLDSAPRSAQCSADVIEALKVHGDVLHLDLDRLPDVGAPDPGVSDGSKVSEAFYDWFSEQESLHRYVVLSCAPRRSSWTDFCEAQSDLILLLADSNSSPRLRDFEHASPDLKTHVKHRVLVLAHPSQTISDTKTWIDLRTIDYHLHLRRDNQSDLDRVGRVLSGNAVGLVLGGGAARGFAHIGVYRALHEAGQPIDWVGGTSIGAIMGVAIALYEEPQSIEKNVREAFVNGKPFGDYTLPLVSILSGNRMNVLSQRFMPGQIEDLPISFFAVSSDINSGEINVHESGPIWRATAASAAMPGMLPPVVYNGSLTVDGAVLNNLPVDVMATKPVGKILAVRLSSGDSHKVEFEDLPSVWKLILKKLLPSRGNSQVPGLATLLFKATEVANRKRTNQLAASADLLFEPPVKEFSLLRVDQFDQLVDVGYHHAKTILEQ